MTSPNNSQPYNSNVSETSTPKRTASELTRRTDEELKAEIQVLIDTKKLHRGYTPVAKQVTSSVARLKRLFPDGLPDVAEPYVSEKTKDLIQRASDLINSNKPYSRLTLARALECRASRLDEALPQSLKDKLTKSMSGQSYGEPNYVKKVDPRRLKKILKILDNHKKIDLKNPKTVKLICEVCERTSFPIYNIEKLLVIDHVFGKKYEDLQSSRAICANCHELTINSRSTLANLPPDFIQTKPNGPVEYKTVNIIKPQDLYKNLKSCKSLENTLEKQKLKTPENAALFKEKLKKPARTIRNSVLLPQLISSGLRKAECESCGFTEWDGIPMGGILHIHHKDQNNQNNELTNLQLLCPNCHLGVHSDDSELVKKGDGTWKLDNRSKLKTANMELALTNPDVIKVKEILHDPHCPPSGPQCAEVCGINPERFQRIAYTFFLEKWEALPKVPNSYWIGNPEHYEKMKYVYDVSFNKNSPLYSAQSVSANQRLFGQQYNLGVKTWTTILNTLKKHPLVKLGKNPFDTKWDPTKYNS